MNRIKFLTLASLLGMSLSIPLAGPAKAVHIGIGINLTPPAERVEVIPARPREGYVWIKGHWLRRDGNWVWVGGRWDNPPRPGGAWVRGQYNRRGEWVEGHWR